MIANQHGNAPRMNRHSRIVLAILGAFFSLMGIFFPLSLAEGTLSGDTISSLTLLFAVLVGIFLFRLSSGVAPRFEKKLFATAMYLAAVGFLLGFLGPIILTPNSAQGPMLGIFITGPLCFVFGLLGGGIYWSRKMRV